MNDDRNTLYEKVLSFIQKINDQRHFPLKSGQEMDFLLLAVFLLNDNECVYRRFLKKSVKDGELLLQELCETINSFKKSGLKPTSYEGARLYLWMMSSDYKTHLYIKQQKDLRTTFIQRHSDRILETSRFSFGVLFDAIFLLSKSRKQVLNLPSHEVWKDGRRGYYTSKNKVLSVVDTVHSFESGWGVEIAVTGIKKHLFYAMRFASMHEMHSLKKVLMQIEALRSLGKEPSADSNAAADYYSQCQALFEINSMDAALDEMFVYVYRKKAEVEYRCRQLSSESESNFVCEREFHVANYSLINSGVGKDDLVGSTSFYSLFSDSGYAKLIAELEEWFETTAA